jgi:oligopeptide/dipeptide ABC transporter ATP-binding protein
VPLLQIRDLRKHFSLQVGGFRRRAAQVVRAVDGVSFRVEQGEALGLVGESGSGKSTLARTILRLYEPTSGSIEFNGVEIAHLSQRELRPYRRKMQMVFQDTKSSLNPRLRLRDIIAEPLITYRLRSRPAKVAELMAMVGLGEEYLGRYPHQLSGGQRQRVGVARAIALDPELIIADEPVSALDVSIQAQILNLLKGLQRRLRLTFILVAHDFGVVSHFADRVAVMYLGRVVELGPTETMMTGPSHPYTRALLAAVPNPDPRITGERIVLAGEIPSPLNPPGGCPFHTRCPVKIGRICEEEAPPEYATGDSGWAACHLLGPTPSSQSFSLPP